jgi:hypothetical protein
MTKLVGLCSRYLGFLVPNIRGYFKVLIVFGRRRKDERLPS